MRRFERDYKKAGGILAMAAAVCIATSLLQAAEPFSAARPAIHYWGGDTRFSRITTYAPFRDSHDRIWVGTPTGPAYLEGDTFHDFPLPADAGIIGIRAVQETRDGSMWFGSDAGGLWQYRDNHWTHHTKADGLPSDGINTMLESVEKDGSSTLWAGTRGGGMARRRDGRWEAFNTFSGLPDDYIWRLRQMPGRGGKPEIWAATKKGVGIFRDGRWTTLPGLPKEIGEVNEMAVDPSSKSGELWISCWGVGVAYWDGGHWTVIGPAQGFPNRNPTALAFASTGDDVRPTLWVGTYDSGLFWRDGQRWQHLGPDQGLPASGIYGLIANPHRYPDLWIGTRGSGLLSIDLSAWRTVDNKQGLPASEITSFASSGDSSSLWIGTSQGLAGWNGTEWQLAGLPGDLRNSRILGIVESGERLWVGTLQGLVVREGARWKRLGAAEGLPQTRVRAMIGVPHPDGAEVWVAFESGQASFRSGKWTFHIGGQDIPDDITGLAVLPSPSGDSVLWAVTVGGALWRRDGEYWVADAPMRSRQINVIRAITTTAGARALWAGGKDGTLWRLDPRQGSERWESFSLPDRLDVGGRTIWAIEADRLGQLYLATNQAYLRLPMDPASLRPNMTNAEFYSPQDGLPAHGQLTLPGLSITDARGRVWFGTPSGAAVLDPLSSTPLPPLPSVRFTSVTADGAELPTAAPARFSYHLKHLEFGFVLPFYNRVDDLQFQTQLIGLEDDPSPWQSETFRKISALRPGSYTLNVVARDHAGRVSAPARFTFQIASPPWLTWWGYTGYALLLGGAIYGVIRRRSRAVLMEKRVLEQAIAERTEELRRKNEELAVARDSALQATKAKSEFLANMSHEIRTPMNGVIGLTELLQESKLDAAQRSFLNTIKDSGITLLALINDILDFSKLEAGQLSLESTDIDLPELVGAVLRSLSVEAFRKGLELAWDAEPDVPRMVTGDPLRLRQVLTNLVGNAIKFTSQGEIVVRVSRETGGGDQRLHFAVSDTGIGIPAAKLEHIFDAFGQADASTTRRYGGSGLGLTISARLVGMMGGRIWVESTERQGATFHFTARFSGTATVPLNANPRLLLDCRVLLAEPNATTAGILERVLLRWSMAPELAPSGAATVAALDRAAREGRPFHVLIVSDRMQDLGGSEILPRTRETGVVLLTSGEMRADLTEAETWQRVPKPVHARELLAALETLLRPAGKTSETAGSPTPPAAAPGAGSGMRILLAEDNLTNQLVAVGMLRNLGYDSVDVVADGREVIKSLSRTDYDLVFMDCQMPELDGYEATALIRSKSSPVRNRGIPVVAMTAHALPEDRDRCLQAGMDDYIAKPLLRETLRQLLQKWAGRESVHSNSG